MGTDFFVHQGLRQARSILLVVAQFTEADDVNHNIFAELHPVFQCQLRSQHHRFRIVAVNVQHGSFNHLHNVRAIHGRTHITRV